MGMAFDTCKNNPRADERKIFTPKCQQKQKIDEIKINATFLFSSR